MLCFRALRGATTIDCNTREEILSRTAELLTLMIQENQLTHQQIISIIFAVTNDVTAVFPAVAARELGLTSVALLDTCSPAVPGSLQSCIRVLLHYQDLNEEQQDARHIFIRGARVLRPDLVYDED